MEAHVLLDATEARGGVVRVPDEEASRLVGELAEAALWIQAQEVLVALEAAGQRARGAGIASALLSRSTLRAINRSAASAAFFPKRPVDTNRTR